MNEQRREIAIRLALGTQRGNILKMVLRRRLGLAAAGAGFGPQRSHEKFRDEITAIVLSCRVEWNLRDKGSPRAPHLPIQTALRPKLPR
ncbi:MAG: hypothetical protein QOI94_2183 [Acidobacteriaceae bacterium]|nr:hypothetical protein [Acidobacteriaceae bacterium]